MSICGFDIGIKNLSFCIIKKEEDKINVIKWELVNIYTSGATCIGKLRNGTTCGKPAKFSCKSHPEILYCVAHKKQYIEPEVPITIENKQSICSYVSASNKTCPKNGNQGIDEKVYCSKHMEQMKKLYIRQNTLTSKHRTSCMHVSLYELGKTMYDMLDKYPEILQVDRVVIENQPSLRNPTMKSIEMILFCYFISKNFSKVNFVAPSGKLKINSSLTDKILKSCKTDRTKYVLTKELSIKYCEKLLQTTTQYDMLKKQLTDSHKKDDLCDAFLHAYYHLYGSVGLDTTEFENDIITHFQNKATNKKEKEARVIKL